MLQPHIYHPEKSSRLYFEIGLLITFLFHLTLNSDLLAQDLEWALQSNSNHHMDCRALSALSNGDVITVGALSGQADIDPSSAVTTLTSNGNNDFFLARYTSGGELVWGFNLGGNDNDIVEDVVVDEQDNIYITGNYRSTFDFDPGPSTVSIPGVNLMYARNIFMAKFNADGDLVWVDHFGNGIAPCFGNSLSYDSGKLILTGSYQGDVDFDPDTSEVILQGFTNSLGYYCQYDAQDGSLDWANGIENSSQSFVEDAWIDSDQNVFICGRFSGTSDMISGPGTYNIQSSFNATLDVFVAKYDSTGTLDFAFAVANTTVSTDRARSIVGDSSGNIYVCGFYGGTCDFDPSAGQGLVSSNGSEDIFIAKYTNSGSFLWVKSVGGSGFDFGSEVSIVNDQPVFSGWISGSVDLNPNSGTYNTNGTSTNDIAAIALSPGGGFNWAMRLNSQNEAYSTGLASDGDSILIGGYFHDTLKVDPYGNGASNLVKGNSNALFDFFIAKYSPCELPELDSIQIIHEASCVGSEVTLSVEQGSLKDAANWRWSKGSCYSTELSDADTASFILTENTNTYWVRGVGNCVLNSSCHSITIEAHDLPSVYAGPDTSLCEGDSLILEATGAESYTWSNNHVNGAYYSIYAIGDSLSVLGTDSNGCSNSDIIFIKGTPLPNVTISQASDTLSVGSNYSSYQWYLDGTALTGETSHLIVIDSFGVYAVEVTDSNQCGNSDNWVVVGIVTPDHSEVNVYPNPTNGTLNVSDPNAFSFELYSMQGQLVSSGILGSNGQIELNGLLKPTAQHYILIIKNQDEIVIDQQPIIHLPNSGE